MIVEKTFPSGFDELLAVVQKYCETADSVVVQAGHFLVYYDHTEDLLLPAVAPELRDPRHRVVGNQVGYFPLLTWQLGLDLLAKVDVDSRSIFCLVNDWQYVPKTLSIHRFYRDNPALFQSYRQALSEKEGIAHYDLFPGKRNVYGDWVSEKYLRKQYAKRIKDSNQVLADQGVLSCDLGEHVKTEYSKIYCEGKRPNCVEEVVELLSVLGRQNIDVLVNIVPNVCSEYVNEGSRIAVDLFGRSPGSVVNVGVPSVSVGDIEELYENMTVVTFRNK